MRSSRLSSAFGSGLLRERQSDTTKKKQRDGEEERARERERERSMSASMHSCMHVCMYVCMYGCMYVKKQDCVSKRKAELLDCCTFNLMLCATPGF